MQSWHEEDILQMVFPFQNVMWIPPNHNLIHCNYAQAIEM